MRQPLLALLVLGVLLPCAPAARAQDAGTEFFEKKVRPVLVEHCYKCHSHETKKARGGLYVDSRTALLEGGDTGPALVPGKAAESLLVKAVRYEHPDLKMPPDKKLPDDVIADLEKWVAMGAPDPRGDAKTKVARGGIDLEAGRKFWAFQPPKAPALPAVKDRAWARGNIDYFVLAALEAKRVRPVQDAHRATLIRRAYFDLVGLPPTAEEVEAFVKSATPQAAYEALVDRLLSSPHFGERWARHWLDVARYSESSGGGRSLLFKEAWRYRDYVIDAFNKDKPFDQFIKEQLAGDLLPFRTMQEKYDYMVATAFLTLGPTNFERQDKPILEMDVIDEQLDTLGKAFLGMTIGCARCHDHKFDPIPTKDYYALAGILKSTKTLIHDNVSKWVEKPLPMPKDQELVVSKHEAMVAALKKQIDVAKAKEKKSDVVTASGVLTTSDLPGIVIDDTHAKKVGPWKHSTFTKTYIGEGYVYDDRGAKADKTLTFVPEFTTTGVYEVRLAYVPFTNRADKVPVRVFHADGDNTVYVNQKLTPPIDGRFVSLGKFRFEQGNQWFVMVSTGGTNGHVAVDAVQFLPDGKDDGNDTVKVAKPRAAKTDLKQLEAELKRLQAGAPPRPMAMTVEDGKPVDMHVCVRGNFHNAGEKVPRGFLQVATVGPAPAIPANESGRRQLAEWVASPGNPLTARVTVNRVWHHLFGAGLVRTVDNFGSTGERPSHPELLDYLATRFVAEGWSVKKLIREIMLSHTYQLASTPSDGGTKADPENRLLWRQNRRRLEAEAIRDTILAVSGKLDRKVGGPNVKKGTTVERDYVFDDARRSVYTPVFRNRLLELFEVFDFADPNMVYGRRNVSTVSTQALYLLNSPFVMEQAKHAAKDLLAQPLADDAARVNHAYRDAVGRLPSERERELALAFLRRGEGAAAWERFYQTLFACVDFRYVD